MKTFDQVRRDAVGHAGRCEEMKKSNGICMCLSEHFACARCGKPTQVYLIETKPDTPDKWFGWCYDCKHQPV